MLKLLIETLIQRFISVPGLSPPQRHHLREVFRHEWHGVTKESTMKHGWTEELKKLAEVERAFQWRQLAQLLRFGANPNFWAIDSEHQNTALHWAALGCAPKPIISQMLLSGGWRTVPNANGERPVDIARRLGHIHLLEMLEPVIVHNVSLPDLLEIQKHFHRFISERDEPEIRGLRLPELAILLELDVPKMYFPVPGNYGGYIFELILNGPKLSMVVESKCRIVSGPIPRYEFTSEGWTRVKSIGNQ